MTFVKGRAKTGGITKGQQWKKTTDWNEISETFKGRYVSRMIEIMDRSDDEAFAKHFKDLLSYFAPQMQRIEAKVELPIERPDLTDLTDEELTTLVRIYDKIDGKNKLSKEAIRIISGI